MKSILAGYINDKVTDKEYVTYNVKAYVTDSYNILSNNSFSLYYKNKELVSNTRYATLNLIKDKIYKLTIKVKNSNINISMLPINNKEVLPFNPLKNKVKVDINKSINKTFVKYKFRNDSTYIYNNHPENMTNFVLNKVISRQDKLKGKCFMTFENQNHTGVPVYLGYRLTNNNKHDVFITITNSGYQVDGSWLGEKSWQDYYQTKFYIPIDEFKNDTFDYENKKWTRHEWFDAYLHFDINYSYEKHYIETYRLPPKQSMFVIGGNFKDSYNNYNAMNQSKILNINDCANGNVNFIITGGNVVGEFVCYDKYEKLDNSHSLDLTKCFDNDDLCGRVGYNLDGGVIDSNFSIEFDDSINGFVNFNYYNYYSSNRSTGKSFKKIKGVKKHLISQDSYNTHLSSLLHNNYIGFDMVKHITKLDNKKVTMACDRYDYLGNIFDYGNWMIEYQDNIVFVNKGNNKREVNVSFSNPGSLFILIKDENNKLIKAIATAEMATLNTNIYSFSLNCKSIKLLRFVYVLPANDCGSIIHKVEVK